MRTPTPESYPAYLATLTGATRGLLAIVGQVDLAELRSLCERMQALAPVLESSAYHRGGGQNLADQAAFLDALQRFKTDLGKLDRPIS